MKSIRRLAAAAALFLSLGAHATPFSSDTSDIWWNPNESGWGMNVIQQGGIQFITLFVYGAGGEATWFVGPDTEFVSAAGGTIVFSGALYQTTGPAYPAFFDPNAVGVKQVGNITLTLTSLAAGSVSYSVNGVVVVKDIERQTWEVENLTGNYLGAATGNYTGACAATGYQEEPAGIAITHTPTSFSMAWTSNSRTCTFSGTHTQAGRMASVLGSFTCTNGTTGTFATGEMQATPNAIAFRITSTASGCAWVGAFSGARRSP